MSRVLVTGATGFVGRAVCAGFARAGYTVRAAVRAAPAQVPAAAETVVVGDIGHLTEWSQALSDVDCVIYAAGKAHELSAAPAAAAETYMEVNARGAASLAACAAQRGVRAFVYLSSVKVNGEESGAQAFSIHHAPNPQGTYALSKWAGESSLMQLAGSTRLPTAIVRLPLVYGPGVHANFLRLMRWVDNGWPLPFGRVRNARSLVSTWNLVDFLIRLVEHSWAGCSVWMVSDGADLSTPELIRKIGSAMGRRVRLLPVPCSVLRVCGAVTGRSREVQRLCSSLVVDISVARDVLGWVPPVTLEDSLTRTARWYLSAVSRHGP